MKRILICSIVLFFIAGPFYIYAHADVKGDRSHGRSLEEVLEEIRQSQEIGENGSVDCARVTDEQFEELGEAFMSIMHPDPEEHALMDRIMGGEDSETLSAMHRTMGARYLDCYSGGMFDEMGPGMMGGWMMSPGRGGDLWRGMGFGYGRGLMHYGFGGIFMWIFFLVIILVLVYLVFHVTKFRAPGKEEPMDVLKRRYAKGEINKEEFERIKKDLEV
ncbi:MAG: SHOCT domain-containing protein [bacterium]